jgi:hypothetical protein
MIANNSLLISIYKFDKPSPTVFGDQLKQFFLLLIKI